MCLCSTKQRWPFSPLVLWSPQTKEGLGCLWLPGPCCFAGGLLSLKPTPTCSSSWRSRIWKENAFWAQAPSIPREPPWALSTETTSQAPLQTLCRELHSGNFDSRRGTNHSPNVPLLSKATLAFFSPSPLVSKGQRGSGLLLAPWPCCIAGGLLSWKHSPNVFSSWRSWGWLENAFWTQAPAIFLEPAWEHSTEAPTHPRLQTRF